MAGPGFVGAGGAARMTDALREIVQQRLLEKKLEEQRLQQEFENRMALRQADTGDARFDRTQGLSEELGRGNLGISQENLGLNKSRFGHDVSQDQRGNRIEDEDRTIAAGERQGRNTFIDSLAGDPSIDQNMRRVIGGLRYNVNVPDTRSAQQRGTDAGVEEGAQFDAGGRRVRQATVDMGTRSGIQQSNAAAANRAPAAPDTASVEAAETAAEVQRLAGLLQKHPGMSSAFGVTNARLPTLRQDTADAEALLNSLVGLLTLDNMGKMKGVLSDNDMKIVRQASSTLNQSMSREAASTELQRLIGMEFGGVGKSPEANTAADRAAALIKKYGGG